MWLDHLKTVDSNRKRGAAKAAETRRFKRCSKSAETSDSLYSCGIYGAGIVMRPRSQSIGLAVTFVIHGFMDVSMLHQIANLNSIFVIFVCNSCVLDTPTYPPCVRWAVGGALHNRAQKHTVSMFSLHVSAHTQTTSASPRTYF